MKIAIDVDDTISQAPEFFAEFCKAMRAAGHEIHIVTAMVEGYRPFRERELENWGIEYDHMEFTCFKDKYCHENGIDYAFDDDSGYYPDEIGTLFRFFKIRKDI